MITEYTRVTFRHRTFVGRQSRDGIGAKNGVRLLRVTEGGRDDLRVTGLCSEPWEVPWTNIASAVAAPTAFAGAHVVAEDVPEDDDTKPAAPKAKRGRR